MARYKVKLIGQTPLLMHADDVLAADMLSEWRKDPANKSVKIAGDDRSPAWSWMTYLYHDGEHVALPTDNLMVSIRKAGSDISLGRMKTMKSLSQAAMMFDDFYLRFTVGGAQIKLADIEKMKLLGFTEQTDRAKALGFALFVSRATVGKAKHVRVRPRFDKWAAEGVVETTDPAITDAIVTQIFELAGRRVGLGDWRPSAPQSPGQFGRFAATVEKI